MHITIHPDSENLSRTAVSIYKNKDSGAKLCYVDVPPDTKGSVFMNYMGVRIGIQTKRVTIETGDGGVIYCNVIGETPWYVYGNPSLTVGVQGRPWTHDWKPEEKEEKPDIITYDRVLDAASDELTAISTQFKDGLGLDTEGVCEVINHLNAIV